MCFTCVHCWTNSLVVTNIGLSRVLASIVRPGVLADHRRRHQRHHRGGAADDDHGLSVAHDTTNRSLWSFFELQFLCFFPLFSPPFTDSSSVPPLCERWVHRSLKRDAVGAVGPDSAVSAAPFAVTAGVVRHVVSVTSRATFRAASAEHQVSTFRSGFGAV